LELFLIFKFFDPSRFELGDNTVILKLFLRELYKAETLLVGPPYENRGG
tara:strand:+ start:7682 stop:7828 length:147 start_codon:yes stop_codon:yes gene_type:complete